MAGQLTPILSEYGVSAPHTCKRLRRLEGIRRHFDFGTVLESARSTDLECEKCPITMTMVLRVHRLTAGSE